MLPLFHSSGQVRSPTSIRMTNDELKRKVNTHGYVLPENSYQYRYSVCSNTHLNNSSPKPFMKAELTAAAASPKTVKKVEFDTEEWFGNKNKRCGSTNSPKPVLKTDTDQDNDNDLCVEHEPGTTDL